MLTIIPAAITDVVMLANIVNAAYRPDNGQQGWTHEADLVAGPRITPQALAALWGERSRVLAATLNDELVGCVHLEGREGVGQIGLLSVLPALQNAGVAKKLLQAAEDYAVKTWGISCFTMWVVNHRPELIAYYQRRGYQLTDQTSAYPVHLNVGVPTRGDLGLVMLEKGGVMDCQK
jgi:GNAT superfamily N-acetyltransferase